MSTIKEDMDRDLIFFKQWTPLDYYLAYKFFKGSWPFQFMRMTLRDPSKISTLWGIRFVIAAKEIGFAQVMNYPSAYEFVTTHKAWVGTKPRFRFLKWAAKHARRRELNADAKAEDLREVVREFRAIKDMTLPAYIYNRSLLPKERREKSVKFVFEWEKKQKNFPAGPKKKKKVKRQMNSNKPSIAASKRTGKKSTVDCREK